LGLLAAREWTTYELANQTQRSFGYFWPRARRRIYDEPARLAAAGYAIARDETVGRRPRRCWRITDAGQQALRDWLEQPATDVPVLEFEGMLKVFAAEHGSKQALLATLDGIAAAARERRRVLAGLCGELATTGGEFPQRVHTNALAMSYMLAVTDATLAWAKESEQTVREWHSVAAPGTRARDRALAFFRRHSRPAER
jgi:DNA-binding PadR family transcriptional regulator